MAFVSVVQVRTRAEQIPVSSVDAYYRCMRGKHDARRREREEIYILVTWTKILLHQGMNIFREAEFLGWWGTYGCMWISDDQSVRPPL
jgi:hypothetical protein